MITRDSFIAELDDVKDVNDHCAFIDRRAAAGDRDALLGIFFELNQDRPRSRIPEWAVGAILERIIEVLALTAGYDNAAAAIELAGFVKAGIGIHFRRLHLPSIASRIVAGQPPEVIDTLLGGLRDSETAALVLHEAVVRGKLSAPSSAPLEIQRRLEIARHPLAVLPLTLLDLEHDIDVPSYKVGLMSASALFGPIIERPAVDADSSIDNFARMETTCPERSAYISAAIKNWQDESNGQIEARTFYVDSKFCVLSPSLLPKLGLESVGSTDEVSAIPYAVARDAFTVLFAAASNGGAYNQGNFAAYGRLLAWQSLAGLVGASADAPIHEIALSAHACQWCLFNATSAWYYQITWDIGIACFNPARREIAVLAATDTD